MQYPTFKGACIIGSVCSTRASQSRPLLLGKRCGGMGRADLSRAAKLMSVATLVSREKNDVYTPRMVGLFATTDRTSTGSNGKLRTGNSGQEATLTGLQRARPARFELAVFALVDVVERTGVAHLAEPLNHGSIRLEHDKGMTAVSWNGHGPERRSN
ncbi:hypothetical protein HYFRA_00009146 [Hymenoscyphus fraxineus]|uniref:Uncharacterized protein n=1 Tax=Hymenoscyphus fraxineus TaxID=746836 RepID=A0A9N9KVV2_9HELO|nr:hypothetical protein HYFRA_00009146 [Hymenoscyphus fraxineus]